MLDDKRSQTMTPLMTLLFHNYFRPRLLALLALPALALTVTACNTSDVAAPPPPIAGTVTVDASAGWVYLDLASGNTVTPAPSPDESSSWDVALFGTNVMLNGGAAGPAGVTGTCLCQNANATNDDVLAMTPAAELADFDAVTSVPAGTQFTEEQLVPAINDWLNGNGSSATANANRVYIVRLAGGTAFAKVRVLSLENPTANSVGRVTLEYAVQPSATAAFGNVMTTTVDVTGASETLVDLNPAAGVSLNEGWDLSLRGFTMRTNGGVSGTAQGGAATATVSFNEATATGLDSRAFRSDGFSGVFATNRFFRYNIAGDNRISPTFDVYLIRRGSTVYKLQIVDYYNDTGAPRHITFRYEQIAG